MERDTKPSGFTKPECISTHTLTWSVTFLTEKNGIQKRISTHTLTWSVTQTKTENLDLKKFQLTRSRGAWRKTYSVCEQEINFNSHAHVERDQNMGRFWFYIEYFNSHAHVERDGYIGSITRKLHNFNSHAHVERDNYPHAPCKIRNISTHTLTWSVTAEVSENSYIHMDFNSHAHVERDVKVYFISVIVWVFQLTRSRGAWPWRSGRSLRCYRHFNSHAHVERDSNLDWIFS